MRRGGPLLGVAAAAVLLAGPATAQGSTGARAPPSAPEAVERARAATAEEQRLAQQRVAAAERLRGIEAEVNARATEVAALAGQRAAAEARLRQHAATLAPVLPLMERLALYPAETLLAVPGRPEEALRGLGVLRGMARTLEREAAALRREQAELDARAAALAEALPRLRSAEAVQTEQAQALDGQIATARALRQTLERAGEQAAADAQRRAAAEAARAETLPAALSSLEAARARAEAQAHDDAARAERQRQEQAAADARRREAALARPPGPGEARGQLLAPVAGDVVRAWGEPTDAGPATGVSLRPAPQARVVAPCAGRVRFAGPFRSFGALIILDCGGGLAFVLAGLERLDVPVGAAVLQGEPVGAMPGWTPGAGSRPALYLELRRDGQAVNPGPFLHGAG